MRLRQNEKKREAAASGRGRSGERVRQGQTIEKEVGHKGRVRKGGRQSQTASPSRQVFGKKACGKERKWNNDHCIRHGGFHTAKLGSIQ